MSKVDKNRLTYLGHDFQLRLLAQLVLDPKFSFSIMPIIDANYFENPHIKLIVAHIKDAFEKHETIPDIKSLEARLLESLSDEFQIKVVTKQLFEIKEINLNDYEWVQETATKFCKQQELKKSIKTISQIIEKGDLNTYPECEEILRKALEHGNNKDDGINVTDDIESVLADDFRKPMRTGINGLDDKMDGGLGKGELAVVLAAFGVGKTTMLTKIANTAKDDGHNVLQIFFEDMPKVIQRKHLACWSKHELKTLSLHKDELRDLVKLKNSQPGILKLKKFPSDGTTIPMIRQYIKKLMAQGFRPDMVILDYIDCIRPSVKIDDPNVAEGAVMRQFETMLSDLNMAGWTAIQGNRTSINAPVVEANQIGGSIKKGQIGHFIVSIAKGLDQKVAKTATMAILKSRFGDDGIVFENILFDNSTVQIDMGVAQTGRNRVEHKQDSEVKGQARVNFVFDSLKKRNDVKLNGIDIGEEPIASIELNNNNNITQ